LGSAAGSRGARRAHDRWNADPSRPTWRGLGLALVFHGSGFTGRGEVVLASRAEVALTRGGLLERAAHDLRRRDTGPRGSFPARRATMAALARRVCGPDPDVRAEARYEPPPDIAWDEAAYRGDAYPVYSYAAAAVDLEIDRTTFDLRVRRVTTAQDVGRAINPRLVEGQILGGTAQGLGYALLEHAVYADGRMTNAQLTNYIIPTCPDMPPVDVTLVEQRYSRGPGGAKGVGELPMDVPAPAVAAAVFQATGAWMTALPILPERLAAALVESAVPRRSR
jgi:CO/xanthine dehydrogenase Mo-binding subunit